MNMDANNIQSEDLWEKVGSLDELELMQVLTNLYESYEQLKEREPGNSESIAFFNKLERAISQVSECNLNRR